MLKAERRASITILATKEKGYVCMLVSGAGDLVRKDGENSKMSNICCFGFHR